MTKIDQEVFLDKGIMNLLLNIPIFNTHRMAAEYLERYDLASARRNRPPK